MEVDLGVDTTLVAHGVGRRDALPPYKSPFSLLIFSFPLGGAGVML